MDDRSLTPRPNRASTTRFDRWDTPQPGSYWRLRKPFPGGHGRRSQIIGQAHEAGVILLLKAVEAADGTAHVFQFAPHPLDDRGGHGIHVHVDAFYDWFEVAHDAAAVRKAELALLAVEMAQTQAKLLEPPPDSPSLQALPYEPVTGEAGKELATADTIANLERYAEQAKANASALTAWIESNTDQLGKQAGALARFHSERAEASLARATQQLEGLEGIQRTVANLRLYVGDDLEISLVTDGAPSPGGEALTIYQDLLALDEETGLHLEQGGIDHRHASELSTILGDRDLVERMIPASRGVVLMRFRATNKRFSSGTDLAAAMLDMAMNEQSQQLHLLVRDGERLWLIALPDELKGLQRLMPNAEEIGSYFNRRGDEIRREHLDYSKAQRAQLGSLTDHAKVLIILWGMYDRGKLLQGWAMPRLSNWLDPDVQARWLALVGQSTMLGQDHESFSDFQARHNAYMGAGATVAVHVDPCFCQDNIPAAFASQGYWLAGEYRYTSVYEWDVDANASVHIGRVRQDDRGLYVDLPLVKEHTHRLGRRITGKLYLQSQAMRHVLVLDRVHAQDMTYFLTSRKERRSYASYLLLFREARSWVDARDGEEAELRSYLSGAISDAGVPVERDRLEAAITDALAIARTARRDKAIPKPGGTARRAYLHAALDNLHALVTSPEARIARVERWAAANGRKPLRLALGGDRQWRLYLEPAKAEHEPLLGAPVHTTVAAVEWAADEIQVTAIAREMLRTRADEHVLKEWGDPENYHIANARTASGAPLWTSHTSPFKPLTYAEALGVVDAMRGDVIRLPTPQQAFDAAVRHMDADKSKMVARLRLVLPVGLLESAKGKASVLVAAMDALGYAYQAGDEQIRLDVLDLIESRYQIPDGHLIRVRSPDGWRAGKISLAAAKALIPSGFSASSEAYIDAANIVGPTMKLDSNSFRLSGMNALGAQLLPWAAERTARAI